MMGSLCCAGLGAIDQGDLKLFSADPLTVWLRGPVAPLLLLLNLLLHVDQLY